MAETWPPRRPQRPFLLRMIYVVDETMNVIKGCTPGAETHSAREVIQASLYACVVAVFEQPSHWRLPPLYRCDCRQFHVLCILLQFCFTQGLLFFLLERSAMLALRLFEGHTINARPTAWKSQPKRSNFINLSLSSENTRSFCVWSLGFCCLELRYDATLHQSKPFLPTLGPCRTLLHKKMTK